MNRPQSGKTRDRIEHPPVDAEGLGACSDHAELAKLMRSAIVMLGFAVDDLEQGLWTAPEWQHLADGLDILVTALRGGEPGQMVIDAERGNR